MAANPEDRPRILEDDEHAQGRIGRIRIGSTNGGLGRFQQAPEVGSLFFVLQLWNVEDEGLRPVSVVPCMQTEIDKVQREGVTVEQMGAVRDGQARDALDGLGASRVGQPVVAPGTRMRGRQRPIEAAREVACRREEALHDGGLGVFIVGTPARDLAALLHESPHQIGLVGAAAMHRVHCIDAHPWCVGRAEERDLLASQEGRNVHGWNDDSRPGTWPHDDSSSVVLHPHCARIGDVCDRASRVRFLESLRGGVEKGPVHGPLREDSGERFPHLLVDRDDHAERRVRLHIFESVSQPARDPEPGVGGYGRSGFDQCSAQGSRQEGSVRGHVQCGIFGEAGQGVPLGGGPRP